MSAFIEKEFGLPTLVYLFYGLSQVRDRLLRVQSEALQSGLSVSLEALPVLDLIPSVRRTSNNKVLVLDLFVKLLDKYKLKVFPGTDQVWCIANNSALTYEDSGLTLADTFKNMWQEMGKNSSIFAGLTQESSTWVLRSMQELQLKFLPTVNQKRTLLEFQDGVFDFSSNKLLPKNTVSSLYPGASCARYFNFSFNDIPWPETLLDTL